MLFFSEELGGEEFVLEVKGAFKRISDLEAFRENFSTFIKKLTTRVKIGKFEGSELSYLILSITPYLHPRYERIFNNILSQGITEEFK